MARHEKMEPWEEELIRQAEAKSKMRDALPTTMGKRIKGSCSRYKRTAVANVQNRDHRAMYV